MGTTANKLTYLRNTKKQIVDKTNDIDGTITDNTTFREASQKVVDVYNHYNNVSETIIPNTTTGKANYLKETKRIYKEAINLFDEGITDQTTFRQYVDKLDNIYSNLPKVTGTGTNITLENTKTGKMVIQPKGNTSQDGEPTPTNLVEIKNVTGDNKVTIRGKNWFDWKNPNIFNSYWDLITNKLVGDISKAKSIYIECKPNSVYTVTKKPGYTFRVATTNAIPANNVEVIETVANHTGSSISINTSDNANYLWVNYFNESNGDVENYEDMMKTIQIEEDSTATSYEPYITPIEKELKLSGNGYNYTLMKDDYITEDCIIHHKRKKVVFDGTENWQLQSPGHVNVLNTYLTFLNNPAKANKTPLNCSIASFDANAGQDNDTKINICTFNSLGINFLLDLSKATYPTLTDFTTWLSNNNITLEYELATEETETIPNTIPLYNQIKELYRTIIPGGTITIETETDEDGVQLIVNASALG